MAISMLKIRRPLGRLIFNMGIAIPGKTVFLIETAPKLYYLVKLRFKRQYITCDTGIFSNFLRSVKGRKIHFCTMNDISMAHCKTAVTLILMHWSYRSLAAGLRHMLYLCTLHATYQMLQSRQLHVCGM